MRSVRAGSRVTTTSSRLATAAVAFRDHGAGVGILNLAESAAGH